MSKRKLLATFLVLIFPFVFCTGCSQAELGLFNLQKEINALEISESQGEFTISGENLPPTWAALFPSGTTYKVVSHTDQQNNLVTCALYTVEGQLTQLLTSLVLQNDLIYLEVDRFLEWGQAHPAFAKLKNILGTTKYLTISLAEYAQFCNLTKILPFDNLAELAFVNTEQRQIYEKVIILSLPAYQNFSTGLVRQADPNFIWEMNGQQASQVFFDLLRYSFKNSDPVSLISHNLLEGLTKEELALFGLEPKTLALICVGAILTMESNAPAILTSINEAEKESQEDPLRQDFLDNFHFTYSLGQKTPETYQSSLALSLKTPFSLQIEGHVETKTSPPFTPYIPTEDILSFTQLLEKISCVLTINIDEGTYTFHTPTDDSQGTLTVHNIDGNTYLPLRQIGELLGAEVSWNAELGKAYVLQDNLPLDMTGVILADRNYIKTRDFAQLGYQVDWDGWQRTATLTTYKF